MIVENQEAAVALLLDPATYGDSGEAIETHISHIFLVGQRAPAHGLMTAAG